MLSFLVKNMIIVRRRNVGIKVDRRFVVLVLKVMFLLCLVRNLRIEKFG